jgi:hypothetical protein
MDQLPNIVFSLIIFDWYSLIKEYLQKVYFEIDVPKEERKCLIVKSRSYTLYGEKLYNLGLDGIL